MKTLRPAMAFSIATVTTLGGGGGKYDVRTVREADKFLASFGWVKGKPALADPAEGEAR